MPILVTGAAGFIGSHLVERLHAETAEPIVGLDNFNPYYDPARKRTNAAALAALPRCTMIEGDFCREGLAQQLIDQYRIDQVVHLGAYGGVRYSVDHPLLYEQTNVAGTLILLEAARRAGLRRFVFASSSSVYGRGAAAPFQEDAPLGVPTSPYGVSKRAGEMYCRNYFELHGVPSVVLRFFSVYGPRLRPDLALAIFTDKIARGLPLPLYGDDRVRRDFTHVSDVCAGVLAALREASAVGETINLGHDAPVEIRELIALLEDALGLPAKIEHLPPRPADLPLTHASLGKAERVLHYRPQIPFAEGVRDYAAWHVRMNAS